MKRLTCPEDKGMCQQTAFGFRLQRLLFPGSPASWPALHTSFGLNNLYKIVSQWLKTSLYLHTHIYILLALFLWRTLIQSLISIWFLADA